jgi:hypothetical protein
VRTLLGTLCNIRHRRLFLSAFASVALLALGLLSTAAAASQRPDSVPAVSASAHGTSAQSLMAGGTSGARISVDAVTYYFDDYYATEL